MFFLGIDFGEKNIGVAYANNDITYPLEVISNDKSTFDKIQLMVDLYDVEMIVVGIASATEDSNISKKAQKFGNALSQFIGIKVVFYDENYSSKDAKNIASELGYKKDRKIDDVAAAVLLQNYLDDKNN
ncbi:MAG: Holliday junction resolvase RuvX [bacterium]|nr:Holliday junction resolvase RuvX [bacterium]